ncbi:unnamed protein product [Heligmosomoides polygyrus]|uniref:C2H2-type domain-containing protein n=1 Tax=Heligmosomoides polygyrus TaxID=6339 RepID=A0A183FVG9_HELPZ|nr:unnamed protein product [Heligmosomoides polygyrus]
MRHVESELSKDREKKASTAAASESSENEKARKSRSSPKRRRRKSGRGSPTYSDSASSRSSRSRSRSRSRRFFLPEDECPYACKQCHRGFYTIKELAEHEIRAHDMKIPCAHCDKNAISVTKLAAHMLFRHAALDVLCHYCDQKFGGPADKLDKSTWDDFRGHVYKEVLKKRMYDHSSKSRGSASEPVALRGVGRCPHGAAVKCKNFPNCPGAKCIYSHGMCRYDVTCNKTTCPFDHTNRPRVCMACVNDMKVSAGIFSPP